MKKYANDDLGVSFALAERYTNREMLNLRSRIFDAGEVDDSFTVRYWIAAVPLLHEWECEVLPDPAAALDTLGTWEMANIIGWVANTVADHIARLEEVPKKS